MHTALFVLFCVACNALDSAIIAANFCDPISKPFLVQLFAVFWPFSNCAPKLPGYAIFLAKSSKNGEKRSCACMREESAARNAPWALVRMVRIFVVWFRGHSLPGYSPFFGCFLNLCMKYERVGKYEKKRRNTTANGQKNARFEV